MFGRFSLILKCGIGTLLIFILYISLSSRRSRLSVESAQLAQSAKLLPSSLQSSKWFSTEGAAVCRQTSTLTDAVEKEQCNAILGGRMTKRRLKKLQPLKVTWQPSTFDDYVKCASDCDRFRSELGYWTSTDNISIEELEFPIAFSLLMYEQFEQFERLFRLIYRPHNFYCLHVDRDSPEDMHRAAQSIASCLSTNVIVARPPIKVKWGTMSIVDAEMLCIKELLAMNGNWKYFINLVGRDFPLKTNWELVRILKAFRGANNISGSKKGHSMPERIRYIWINGVSRTKKRKKRVPYKITLSKGSTHIAARREFVDFALNDPRAQSFTRWLRNTRVPDETFFNSLNRSPQLNIPGSYNGTRTVRLVTREKRLQKERPRKYCAGRWIRWICSVSIGDLHWVTSSRMMFLNKIRIELDPVAYRCLELWYADRVRSELSIIASNGSHPLNLTFYESQDFVKNHI